MKKSKNIIKGFSLLEKALRSGLNSPLNRWFNKARNPRIPSLAFAHSSAFSLAEAMVVLVIIAIVMAMAAPLIAHKANTDQKRLIFNGVSPHIATAMGNSQNFGIGDNNPNDAKLTVKATNNSQNLIAKFISNYTPSDDTKAKKPIFQVKPASGDKLINENGFQVFADGTTNAACIPDYENSAGFHLDSADDHFYSDGRGRVIVSKIPNTSPSATGTNGDTTTYVHSRKFVFRQDGYFVFSRCVRVYSSEENYNLGENYGSLTCPPIDITFISLDAGSNAREINGDKIKRVYQGYITIPVAKGMVITDNVNNLTYYDGTPHSYVKPVDGRSAATYFPCRK